jgi:hypothetical protein
MYIYRRLMKALEDLSMQYDTTVYLNMCIYVYIDLLVAQIWIRIIYVSRLLDVYDDIHMYT